MISVFIRWSRPSSRCLQRLLSLQRPSSRLRCSDSVKKGKCNRPAAAFSRFRGAENLQANVGGHTGLHGSRNRGSRGLAGYRGSRFTRVTVPDGSSGLSQITRVTVPDGSSGFYRFWRAGLLRFAKTVTGSSLNLGSGRFVPVRTGT